MNISNHFIRVNELKCIISYKLFLIYAVLIILCTQLLSSSLNRVRASASDGRIEVFFFSADLLRNLTQ